MTLFEEPSVTQQGSRAGLHSLVLQAFLPPSVQLFSEESAKCFRNLVDKE